MSDLRIIVYGQPAPQGSKRAFVNRHTGKPALVESSKQRVRTWREDVKQAVLGTGTLPLVGPQIVSMVFSLRRPRSHYRTGCNAHLLRVNAPVRPHGKPDLSKLARSTEDALTDAGAWLDDAQAVEYERLAKVWCGEDPDALDVPGAIITIRQIGGD